jgi:hypothetical protein
MKGSKMLHWIIALNALTICVTLAALIQQANQPASVNAEQQWFDLKELEDGSWYLTLTTKAGTRTTREGYKLQGRPELDFSQQIQQMQVSR